MSTTVKVARGVAYGTAGKTATRPNKAVWMVWLALGSASLSKAMLTEGVAIGDVLFGCTAVACLLSLCRRRPRIYIRRWSVYIVILMMWAAVGGLLASGYSSFDFSWIEFLKSFAKLSFYGIGAILLGLYIRKVETDTKGQAVFDILTLHALIALYIYVAELLEQSSGVHLPYEFLWFGQGGPSVFGKELAPRIVADIVLNKARGIFSEPSTFGIFQVLGLAFLYFRSPTIVQRHAWKHVVMFTSLLLTFSLITYGMLSILLLILALKQRQIKQLFSTLRLLLGAFIVLFLLFTLTPLRLSDAFQEVIIDRFSAQFLQGLDRSGSVRLRGSWDTALEIVADSPFVGSGLGNLDFAFAGTGRILYYEKIVFERAAIFNILFYVLGSMGVVGFAIFTLLIAHLMVRIPSAGAVFLVSLFGGGTFLETPFWVYYVLLVADRCVDVFAGGRAA